jgi:hypothetical protein
MVQSSAPKDLIMPALTHIRRPTASHEMMKKATPTPQIGALLSTMFATFGGTDPRKGRNVNQESCEKDACSIDERAEASRVESSRVAGSRTRHLTKWKKVGQGRLPEVVIVARV